MSLVVVAAALVFRTRAVPLDAVLAHAPIVLNLLAGSLAGVGEQTQAYKGWVGVIPRLLTWAESGS